MAKKAHREELLKKLRQLLVAASRKCWELELLRREELENKHLRIKIEDSRLIPQKTIDKHTLEAYKLKFILKKSVRIFAKVNQFKKCEDFRVHCQFISIFCKSDFPNTIKHVCLDYCPHDIGNSIYWAKVLFNRLIKGTCIMRFEGYKSLSDYYYYEEERIKCLQRIRDYINNVYNTIELSTIKELYKDKEHIEKELEKTCNEIKKMTNLYNEYLKDNKYFKKLDIYRYYCNLQEALINHAENKYIAGIRRPPKRFRHIQNVTNEELIEYNDNTHVKLSKLAEELYNLTNKYNSIDKDVLEAVNDLKKSLADLSKEYDEEEKARIKFIFHDMPIIEER